MEALSKTGGIIGIVYGIFHIIVGFIDEFYMYAELISILYKTT